MFNQSPSNKKINNSPFAKTKPLAINKGIDLEFESHTPQHTPSSHHSVSKNVLINEEEEAPDDILPPELDEQQWKNEKKLKRHWDPTRVSSNKHKKDQPRSFNDEESNLFSEETSIHVTVTNLPDDEKPLLNKPSLTVIEDEQNFARALALEIMEWFKETAQGVKDHPLATVLGALTSLQPAFNAGLNPSHTNSKDFNLEAFKALPPDIQAMSFVELISSFLVNYPAGKKFIGDALKRLETTKDMFQGVQEFFDNFSSLIIGIDSGAGAAALTFTAFAWIVLGGPAIPSALGGLSFVITSASRYLLFRRAIMIATNFFSHDAHVQRQAIDELKHLKLDEAVTLTAKHVTDAGLKNNDELKEGRTYRIGEILQTLTSQEAAKKRKAKLANENLKKKDLNDDDYEDLFVRLVEVVNALDKAEKEPHLFSEKTIKEHIANYINIVSQISFASIFGFSAAAVFLQEGFTFAKIVSNLTANYDLDADDMNEWYKRLIGLLSGIGSGTTYAVSAADFPKLFFVDLPLYLKENPRHIISAIFLVVTNYFASYSMFNVTENIFKQKNILGLLNAFKKEMPYIVQLGGAFVNIRSKLMEYKKKAKDPNDPQVEDVIRHFEDPNFIRIKPATATTCSVAMTGASFFKQKAPAVPKQEPDLTKSYGIPSYN